jgi:hypothetical protein
MLATYHQRLLRLSRRSGLRGKFGRPLRAHRLGFVAPFRTGLARPAKNAKRTAPIAMPKLLRKPADLDPPFRCPGCGYDTMDFKDTPCPECGLHQNPEWRRLPPRAGRASRVAATQFSLTGFILAGLGMLFLGATVALMWFPTFGPVNPTADLVVNTVGWAGFMLFGLAYGITGLMVRNRILFGPRVWTWRMLLGFPLAFLAFWIVWVILDAIL